ncbi:trehalose 6-phosphate phosphatase [Izhakiella capsodis]|uniref:Trehalose 6-phosphate phosphatase n=1 Tax=Izhakiella capsodis TaxID=1367852 RepID=A0A1I4UVS9_9GAMM|nr:trehalose-phosphatase [Izhakiella capsodis]SFM92853.1 trehalose 6-phosphate phosphatase [Izhakiella capsodis]
MNHPAVIAPVVTLDNHAFFFDVDGTLAAIQSRPDEVFIPSSVITCLQKLSVGCGNALALVSGRPLSELDALTAPLRLPLAGVHGAERRDVAGKVHCISLPDEVSKSVLQQLRQVLATLPGTLLESKGMAFALHFRNAPEYADEVQDLAEKMVMQFPQLVLQPGKCVVELKPKGVDKGLALHQFMQEALFSGRIPVFVGDDVTDETGFGVVNALGGVAIKVGQGQTQASFRMDNVEEVHRWLEKLTSQLHQDTTFIGKELR